jgi:hypothetical protein
MDMDMLLDGHCSIVLLLFAFHRTSPFTFTVIPARRPPVTLAFSSKLISRGISELVLLL